MGYVLSLVSAVLPNNEFLIESDWQSPAKRKQEGSTCETQMDGAARPAFQTSSQLKGKI